jgi:Flp pilus assembly protein TadB
MLGPTLRKTYKENDMGILRFLGAAIIVLWLVLWLAVKVTFGAIHLLVVLGIIMLVMGFMKAAR